MTRLQELQSKADEIRQIAARYKAHNIAVFGSVARGEEHRGSDIDFLMDFEPGTTLFDLVHLQEALEAFLGSHVDLIAREALKPRDTDIRQDAVAL